MKNFIYQHIGKWSFSSHWG